MGAYELPQQLGIDQWTTRVVHAYQLPRTFSMQIKGLPQKSLVANAYELPRGTHTNSRVLALMQC